MLVHVFTAQFVTTTVGGNEPGPETVGAAHAHMVDSDITLPEEEIEREDH